VKKQDRVKHEFVELIPQQLDSATVYISGTYATCAHLCLCGCGNKVVTPLSPTDWTLTFDGESISLHPSIGNWSFDCQSHYVIRKGRVIWAPSFSKEQIQAVRAQDRLQKQSYYGELEVDPAAVRDSTEQGSDEEPGWLWRVLHRRRRQ
jgi:hypothetical protein